MYMLSLMNISDRICENMHSSRIHFFQLRRMIKSVANGRLTACKLPSLSDPTNFSQNRMCDVSQIRGCHAHIVKAPHKRVGYARLVGA